MPEPINPYAAPATMDMHPKAAEWLGTPNDSLRRVATGLGLIRTGLLVVVLAIVVGIIGKLLVKSGGGGKDAEHTVDVIVQGLSTVAGILNLVGGVMCLATPAETGAQGLIYAAVSAQVLSILINIGSLFIEMTLRTLLVAAGVQQLLLIAAYVTFFLFLRKLSLFIGRTDLAQRAMTLLILGGVMFACIGVMVASFIMAANNMHGNDAQAFANALAGMAGLIAILTLAVIVLLIVTFFKYLSLLGDMKSAILTGR